MAKKMMAIRIDEDIKAQFLSKLALDKKTVQGIVNGWIADYLSGESSTASPGLDIDKIREIVWDDSTGLYDKISRVRSMCK